jgi:hypothetical protein
MKDEGSSSLLPDAVGAFRTTNAGAHRPLTYRTIPVPLQLRASGKAACCGMPPGLRRPQIIKNFTSHQLEKQDMVYGKKHAQVLYRSPTFQQGTKSVFRILPLVKPSAEYFASGAAMASLSSLAWLMK